MLSSDLINERMKLFDVISIIS